MQIAFPQAEGALPGSQVEGKKRRGSSPSGGEGLFAELLALFIAAVPLHRAFRGHGEARAIAPSSSGSAEEISPQRLLKAMASGPAPGQQLLYGSLPAEHEGGKRAADLRAAFGEALAALEPAGESRMLAQSAVEGESVQLGKGHEQSIIHGTERRPWDDRTAAREALAAAGWAGT